MIIPAGDDLAWWYQEYIDVDLSVLSECEEVVHRAPALYRNRWLTTRSGSLILTTQRVIFLSPRHTLARWRNCVVSIDLKDVAQVLQRPAANHKFSMILDNIARYHWRLSSPRGPFGIPEQVAIDLNNKRRYLIVVSDAVEWCGAIDYQRALFVDGRDSVGQS